MKKAEKTKKFRDPIYGYIEIEESIVNNIIDTATFQRLRNIRQTSYGPLYPSSLHNRFVHSLGVYHLGGIAFESIIQSLKDNETKETRIISGLNALIKDSIYRYEYLFRLACLLHDVGHSPFSHTGETFYLNSCSDAEFMNSDEKNKIKEEFQTKIKQAKNEEEKKKIITEYEEKIKYSIHKHLSFLTKDTAFREAGSYDASAHELMSCIIALETFGDDERYFRNDDDRSFFARCITGIQYEEVTKLKQSQVLEMNDDQWNESCIKMLLNCFISLLHSSVIDVDRLDYIIRDASTTGYQSVSVDYERLLNGLEILLINDYQFTVGFHKNAISVIENAVYAHEIEKKWIQSHPAILYESYLLNQAIVYIEEKIKIDYPNSCSTLFSYNSLTDSGSSFIEPGAAHPNLTIRYLGDADIIFLMKNKYRSKYADEYFSRNTRRLPIWKSEAEFKNLFDVGERNTITRGLEILLTDEAGAVDSIEINDKTLDDISRIIDQSKTTIYKKKVEFLEKKRNYAIRLLNAFEQQNIKNTDKSIVLLSKSFFKSNFSKDTMKKLPLLFPGSNKRSLLENVTSTLSSDQPSEGKLVYLFYHPGANRQKINVQSFAKDLLDAFRELEAHNGR